MQKLDDPTLMIRRIFCRVWVVSALFITSINLQNPDLLHFIDMMDKSAEF